MTPTGISGFTIVRNARKLDYPFVESVHSALPLCDEFIINCGDSEDDTWALCEDLKRQFPSKIQLLRSRWEKENQKGGWQLKAQSDYAMKACKQDWLLYLQADEVLHEDDYPKILAAKEKAHPLPHIDGVLFDWVHFYGNYDYEIKGRNWYRREVRLFKNHRQIEAFRDAQGFRKQGERLLVIRSGARVFHYGYVRTSDSLRTKTSEMSQWWGEKPSAAQNAFQLRRHVGLKRFELSHPATMSKRLVGANPEFDPSKCPREWTKDEIKNAITLAWEKIFPYRIGEFRNYEISGPG